jgi:hypothetical protein
VIEDNEQSAQWQSQHGEARKVSIIQLWSLRQTYVSGINAQRSNIRSLHSLNHTLVFSSIADDEDDKSSSLHIQRQGSRQRKGGRTGDNDDISTTAISRSSRTSCLSHRTALIVSLVNDSTAGKDDSAGQNFVLRNPVLQSLKARQRNYSHHFLYRRLGPHRLWDPFRRGEGFSDDYSGAVDILIDELGGNVGIPASLGRELQDRIVSAVPWGR